MKTTPKFILASAISLLLVSPVLAQEVKTPAVKTYRIKLNDNDLSLIAAGLNTASQNCVNDANACAIGLKKADLFNKINSQIQKQSR